MSPSLYASPSVDFSALAPTRFPITSHNAVYMSLAKRVWSLMQVERLSHELFPLNWHLATRCAKDAVICGMDYTRENLRLLNSTSTNELKQYFYR